MHGPNQHFFNVQNHAATVFGKIARFNFIMRARKTFIGFRALTMLMVRVNATPAITKVDPRIGGFRTR